LVLCKRNPASPSGIVVYVHGKQLLDQSKHKRPGNKDIPLLGGTPEV